MAEVELLKKLPKTKRDVAARAHNKSVQLINIAKKFGKDYLDGHRSYGYGGYKYDGRWLPVAEDICQHFKLKSGDRVLDVGCAKGFLVKDLMLVCPGLEVLGVDISDYAISSAEPELQNSLICGTCENLPFSDNSFDAVISINTIHNCARAGAIKALAEIQRLSSGKAFVQVDAYLDEEQKALFVDWVLTAEFHGYPEDWRTVFDAAGYTGDYAWTIV